jgi:hypothetical protein
MRTPLFKKLNSRKRLAQDLVVELVVLLEDVGVGQEMHLRATLFSVANDASWARLQRR